MTARWEGGLSNDPDDLGGLTNSGVTQKTYDAYRKDHGLRRKSVRNITTEEITDIYLTRYWHQVRGDDLPAGVDLAVYDFGVNSGPGRSVRYLQEILGVKADGVLGAHTLAAVRRAQTP